MKAAKALRRPPIVDESRTRADDADVFPAGVSWWRQRLPEWPNAWRREWGERANAYEGQGLGWREAEEKAFREVAAAHGED